MENKIYRPHFTTAKDARVVRTRESLRRALLELLQTSSFESITIREIAATAGIGYTTFFRHHPTKESLLDEIAAEEMRRLLEFVQSGFDTEDTRAASLALFNYVDRHRALWSTLLTGGAASTLRDEFIRVSKRVAEDAGRSADWLPAEVGIVLVASGTIELLAWWKAACYPAGLKSFCMNYSVSFVGSLS